MLTECVKGIIMQGFVLKAVAATEKYTLSLDST